jgi:DNA-binding IclR family transcriptional regulator
VEEAVQVQTQIRANPSVVTGSAVPGGAALSLTLLHSDNSPAEVDKTISDQLLDGLDGGRHASSTAVGKALGLLDALGSGRPAEPLTVVASRAGLPKSTACRILKMMEELGFVGRQDSLYCLGPRVLALGKQARLSSHNELRTASIGVLDRLYDEVRTTVHLGVLAGSEVLYVEKITAPGGSRIPTRVGSTQPAACTALGKAQLAFAKQESVQKVLRAPLSRLTHNSVRSPGELLGKLAEIRKLGVAVDREEFRAGLSCVAAPIMVRGRPVAAISASSVAGPAYTGQRIRCVREAAQRIGIHLERLGWLNGA